MDITTQTYVSLEKSEKESIQILADAYSQCLSDGLLDCKDCPFDNGNTCLAQAAYSFETKKGKQL